MLYELPYLSLSCLRTPRIIAQLIVRDFRTPRLSRADALLFGKGKQFRDSAVNVSEWTMGALPHIQQLYLSLSIDYCFCSCDTERRVSAGREARYEYQEHGNRDAGDTSHENRLLN